MIKLLCDYLHELYNTIVAHLPSCHCTSNHFNFCMCYFEFYLLSSIVPIDAEMI